MITLTEVYQKVAADKKETYPISRALTSPAFPASVTGGALAAALASVGTGKRGKLINATIGALIGGTIGYSSGVLGRYLHEKGRQAEKKRFKARTKAEHIGQLATNPLVGLVTGGPSAYLSRTIGKKISERAKKGRIARGGKGLFEFEAGTPTKGLKAK